MTAITTEPARLVRGLAELEYHAMPGLSATGMRWVLRSPAHFRWQVDHRVERPEFDFGHAVHAKVLGVGLPVAVIPDEMLSSNGAAGTRAAREFVEQARADGLVPIKADTLAEVDTVAEAVLAHRKASPLLALAGDPEVSLFGTDPTSGVHVRGRIDYLARLSSGRVVNVDLKTTTDVRRIKVARSIKDHGYAIQSEAYRHLLRLNGLDPAPAPDLRGEGPTARGARRPARARGLDRRRTAAHAPCDRDLRPVRGHRRLAGR